MKTCGSPSSGGIRRRAGRRTAHARPAWTESRRAPCPRVSGRAARAAPPHETSHLRWVEEPRRVEQPRGEQLVDPLRRVALEEGRRPAGLGTAASSARRCRPAAPCGRGRAARPCRAGPASFPRAADARRARRPGDRGTGSAPRRRGPSRRGRPADRAGTGPAGSSTSRYAARSSGLQRRRPAAGRARRPQATRLAGGERRRRRRRTP